MKKLAAFVLVLIMCFSVSIGGTFANLQGAVGYLASDVFVHESNGVNIEIRSGERVSLLPGTTVNGSAVCFKTETSAATVTLKFTVPTLEEKPIITVSGGTGWTENGDGTFTKTIPANSEEDLGSFKFTLDSRVDIVDGEMVVVESGVIKDLDWNGLATGYIKIDATTGEFSSSGSNQ